ncbi:MAG: hypothetical protein ACP5N1_06460 [Candidatus Woesearchaeota archaeon]
MVNDNTTNFKGKLLEILVLVNPETIKHTSEIQKARRNNSDIRNDIFCTGELSLYRIENNNPVIYLANRENNVILQNLNDAISQIKTTGVYFPTDLEVEKVINSSSTLRTELSDLKLKNMDKNYSFFEIYLRSEEENSYNNYDQLNNAQRLISERVHGMGNKFNKTMACITKYGLPLFVNSSLMYFFNPSKVKNILSKNNKTSFACGTSLAGFNSGSYFIADHWNMTDIISIRGSPLVNTRGK